MPNKTRVPRVVGSIPVVGDVAKAADAQAQWTQDLIEQNVRLVGQLPDTIKSFNDTLERFNSTVQRLDALVATLESAADAVVNPLAEGTTALQKQVDRLGGIVDRVVGLINELPGAGLVRRLVPGLGEDDAVDPGAQPAATPGKRRR